MGEFAVGNFDRKPFHGPDNPEGIQRTRPLHAGHLRDLPRAQLRRLQAAGLYHKKRKRRAVPSKTQNHFCDFIEPPKPLCLLWLNISNHIRHRRHKKSRSIDRPRVTGVPPVSTNHFPGLCPVRPRIRSFSDNIPRISAATPSGSTMLSK